MEENISKHKYIGPCLNHLFSTVSTDSTASKHTVS